MVTLQGSTYIYQNHLHPFLTKNEAALDAAIVGLQSNAVAFIQAKISDLFSLIANKQRAAGAQSAVGAQGADPAAWQSAAASLWNTYGASVINSVRPQAPAGPSTASPTAQRSNPTTPNKRSDSYSASSSAVPNPAFPTPQHFTQ